MNWAIFAMGVVVGVLLKTLIVFTLKVLMALALGVVICVVVLLIAARVMSNNEP